MKNTTQAICLGILWCLANATWAVDADTAPVQAATGSQGYDSTRQQDSTRKPVIDTVTQASMVSAKLDDKALAEVQQREALADYRALFLNGTTGRDMEAFIAQYKDADPDKLVPRARIRMRTFAAYEAANNTHQCRQAQTLHKRILGYKVTLPFSYEACMQERAEQGADSQALYLAGVRFEDEGERASARTMFRIILDRFPRHPIALKAADRLARLAEIEATKSASSDTSNARATPAPTLPVQANSPSSGAVAACPKDLGYIQSRMVFSELRNNPSFAEPIEGIIHKAGGLDAAIAELKRLLRDNQQSLNQASDAMRQHKQTGGNDPLTFRCGKPEGSFCTVNYYYHLLKEGEYYYAELLNSLRCRETGVMTHVRYRPAPIKAAALRKASPAAGTTPR